MKYILSPVASQINGPIGGLTFVKHARSPYVRGNPLPTGEPSSAQADVRYSYGACVELWRSLLPEVRGYWNALANYREISGFNYFIATNLTHELAGTPTEMTPPAGPIPAPEGAFYSWDISTQDRNWGWMVSPAPAYGTRIYWRDLSENVYTFQASGQKDQSTFKYHESFFNSAVHAGYDFDGDIPTRTEGGWPDMKVNTPGNITQGVTSFGLNYNRYPDAGGYNYVDYQGSPNFHFDQDWGLSFWVYFEEPSAGDPNQHFLECDPCFYARRINFGGEIEFRFTRTVGNQNFRVGPVDDNKWYHVLVENDATNNQYRFWYDGHLVATETKTGSGDTANVRDYVIGGNPYRSSYNNIRIGNLYYYNELVKPLVIWYDHSLFSADFRSCWRPGTSPSTPAIGHIFNSGAGIFNLSADSSVFAEPVEP